MELNLFYQGEIVRNKKKASGYLQEKGRNKRSFSTSRREQTKDLCSHNHFGSDRTVMRLETHAFPDASSDLSHIATTSYSYNALSRGRRKRRGNRAGKRGKGNQVAGWLQGVHTLSFSDKELFPHWNALLVFFRWSEINFINLRAIAAALSVSIGQLLKLEPFFRCAHHVLGHPCNRDRTLSVNNLLGARRRK